MARVQASGRVASTRTNNLLYNGNFEVAPATITAATNVQSRFVDGTAAGANTTTGLGWGTVSIANNAEVGWDSSNAHSGTYALRLSATNSTGTIVVGTYVVNPKSFTTFRLFPSTIYKLTGWIKTNNVASNSAFIDLREYSSTFSTLATTSSTKFTGTNAYTQVTFNVTTNASTAFGTILLRNSVAGNVSDAWYDDITVIPTAGIPGRVAASGRVAI